jgi:hypothetical protein
MRSFVMIDIDTFLTYLYVMVDDFCKQHPSCEYRPGPRTSLTCSEVVTLALFGQWCHFTSERDFYRYARHHLRGAFPGLPDRTQFNRLTRRYAKAVVAFFLDLVELLDAQHCPYEALDGTAAVTRDAKRRGSGWLPGLADIGWSNRLGWYEGFDVLLSVNPLGAITGFGFGSASTKDQPLAETFFALRAYPDPGLRSVGAPAQGLYVTDKGFEGQVRHRYWQEVYGAVVICAPKRNSLHPWPRPWRRWLAGIRQIVETVNGCIQHVFRLDRDRPHSLDGFQVRLAAKMALHDFCIWLNQQLGRAPLAFADLVAW